MMNIAVSSSTRPAGEPVDVVIIGSGLGGLGAAVRLKEAGYDRMAILERTDSLGGVWRENRYPNVACDTPIDLYAFSFFPGNRWSANFAPGNEILSYLHELAEVYGVDDRIEYGADVTRTAWDDDRAVWRVECRDGRRWEGRYLVWAGGILSRPLIPRLPGLDAFEGEMFHTALWPDEISLDGKAVAVVGGGATSIQVVPHAAEHAKRLYAFVRTPSYVLPRPDIVFSQADRDNPDFAKGQRARRKEWFDLFEFIGRARFPMNDEIIGQQETNWRKHFDAVITDPHLRAVLTPDYRFGCKRPLFSNDYYPALTRPNVEVVGRGVARLGEKEIVDTEGRAYPVDTIIWATGFDPQNMLGGLEILGRDGKSLAEAWHAIPEAYYGTFVKGFPNLFLINGPNAGGASVTDLMEAQLGFILRALRAAEEKQASSVEVSEAAHDAFNRDIQRRANDSVMVLGNCASWYRVGGTGGVFTHWPGTIEAFQREIANQGLEGLEFGERQLSMSAADDR